MGCLGPAFRGFVLLLAAGSTVVSAQTSYTWNLVWQSPPSGGSTLLGLAYDQARNQAVLVDNVGGTWTWDSATRIWIRPYPAHNPSNRSAIPLAWDGNLNGVLMFGGNAGGAKNDTWLWNGSDWTLVAPATTSPPARYGAGMVWDSVHNQVVLFGGHTGASADVIYNDVWVWNGSDWSQAAPDTSKGAPAGRYNFAMAYDPVNQAVVIYGGNQGTPATSNDTWLLTTGDGVNYQWSNPLGLNPTADYAPVARANVVMTWDPVHRVIVLFGGSVNNAETWEWDTSALTWTFQGLKVSPTGRNQHLMWFDPSLQQVVVTQGTGGGSLNDVWTWDGVGVNWVALTPNLRFGSALTYDSKGHAVYLTMGCNGLGNTKYTDFWSWTGSTWTQQSGPGAPINPVPRALTGTVYDPVQDRILTWSGLTGTGNAGFVSTNYVYAWSPALKQWIGTLPGVRPGARGGFGWAYVPGPGKPVTVLTGGADTVPTLYGTTYVWDSAANTFTAQSGTGPSARGGTNMVYDSLRGQVVLFGGTTTTNQTTTNVTTLGVDYNDTWIGKWDGNNFTWTNAIPNGADGSPPARSWASMAFDGQYVWLTGGMANGDEKAQQAPGKTALFFNDMWRWDGTSWTQVVPATGPVGLSAMGMTFDPDHGTGGPNGTGELLLFGGNYMTGTGNGTVNANANTWVWDVAQPGTLNVAAYTTQPGTIQDLAEATYTIYGPCNIADPSPCTKNPAPAAGAYSTIAQPGFYSVVFDALDGYTKPATQNIMLNSGSTITFSANWN